MRLGMLGVVLWVGVAWGQDEPTPRLEFESQTHDFGELIQGQETTIEFPFRNTGDAPLEIRQVETSCGCTISDYPADPIPPGEAGVIVLHYDSHDRQGLQLVNARVYSNDPSQTDQGAYCTILQIRGDVRNLVRALPGGAFFGHVVRNGDPQTRQIRIQGQGALRGFQPRLVSPVPDFMQLELTAEDRGHLLTITLLPHAPIGDVTERFTFETGLEIQPRFDIPAVGIVTGRYTALEPLVQLGVERGRGASRRLVVERRDGRDGIPLHGIEFDNTLLQVTPDPVSAQRLDLIVEVLPLAPPGRHGTQLRVRFDDPHQPALEIPVFVEVLPSVRLDPAELLADDGAYPTLTIRSPLGEVLCPDAPGANATLTAQGDGVWTLTLDGTPSGPLILHTDVPGEPTVLVPVR